LQICCLIFQKKQQLILHILVKLQRDQRLGLGVRGARRLGTRRFSRFFKF
jgi:hypothetical protein